MTRFTHQPRYIDYNEVSGGGSCGMRVVSSGLSGSTKRKDKFADRLKKSDDGDPFDKSEFDLENTQKVFSES
ncbi:hypothetical protein N9L06_02350 [Mariniblastus sp.]|nr:hypothetical protein [Mariniblastus sp.]